MYLHPVAGTMGSRCSSHFNRKCLKTAQRQHFRLTRKSKFTLLLKAEMTAHSDFGDRADTLDGVHTIVLLLNNIEYKKYNFSSGNCTEDPTGILVKLAALIHRIHQ